MAIERPTFNESWYRVSALCPRLRSALRVYRQHFRGQMWHVLQDPGNNQFYRLNEPAYRFVSLLNGRRSVSEAWDICNEQLGDEAPTQGEAIQLLGQLYASNLLHADVPPDAEGLFGRFQKRVRREIQGTVMNFLFIRIPLFDPDRILNTFLPAVRWIFSWVGLVLWAVIVATGLYFVGGHVGLLARRASGILDADNLPLLYLSFVLVKVFHEFGHAFACKAFGQKQGSGGEVHTMGLMFLVFTPLPYVDASSSWAFRSKWHRVIVGAAGMMIELAIAAGAAILWVYSSEGTALHAIAYNVMFIASVSTLLFNGNPLLRYDSYYILSDILEIPNLSQRSKEYIYYLVKRWVWGVKRARTPAHSRGEKGWMFFYGIASTIYRVFICTAILMVVAEKFFMLGAALALAAGITWVLLPIGKFFRYVLTSPELARVRWRAMLTTAVVLGAMGWGIGLVRAPRHAHAEGVIDSMHRANVYSREGGYVEAVVESGTHVSPDGQPLLQVANPELTLELERLDAERKELELRRQIALGEGKVAEAEILKEALAVKDKRIAHLRQRVERMTVHAPLEGEWIAPDLGEMRGGFLPAGQAIGAVASLHDVRIRALAGQDIASAIMQEAEPTVRIRVKGRPDLECTGRIEKILPAGQETLLAPAMAQAVGGSVATDPAEPERTAERVFEIRIVPDQWDDIPLLIHQRVVVRFDLPDQPLARQWWQKALRLFQKRFHI